MRSHSYLFSARECIKTLAAPVVGVAMVAGVLAAAGARAATITMSANLSDDPKDRRLTEARRLAEESGA